MAKRTIKQTDATDVKKGATSARRAAAGTAKTTKPRTPRRAAATFVPPTPEEIAVRAYFRAMERGFTAGNAMEDWLAAEAELIAWRQNAAQQQKATRKSSSGK